MKTKEVIKKLTQLNKWRRDDTGKIAMPDPKETGIVIDRAIELLEGMLNRNKI
jgi:hypothetical protein